MEKLLKERRFAEMGFAKAQKLMRVAQTIVVVKTAILQGMFPKERMPAKRKASNQKKKRVYLRA